MTGSYPTGLISELQLKGDAWAEFVPFLAFDVEIRKVICSTNAIESDEVGLEAAWTKVAKIAERPARTKGEIVRRSCGTTRTASPSRRPTTPWRTR